MERIIALMAIVVALVSCRQDHPPAEKAFKTALDKKPGSHQEYIVNVDALQLRADPGKDAEIVAQLIYGTLLTDLGEISDFSTRIRLFGTQYNEPWIKVRTPKGQEGWVFPGGLSFKGYNLSPANQMLINNRIRALFGKNLYKEIEQYRQWYTQADDPDSFHRAYRFGEKLRDTLVDVLGDKVEFMENGVPQDLFWLRHALPGYVPQLVDGAKKYQLFKDFKVLQEKALETKGTADEDFIALCLRVYQLDSVEYLYPSWRIDEGAYSLLGSGRHLDLLAGMDQMMSEDQLFIEELTAFKAKLISDIADPSVGYWEPGEKILLELGAIVNADYEWLSREDKIVLETRKNMFENPRANGISVNLRSGLTE